MTTLRQGDRGPEVMELQILLGVTGFPPGPYDGVYGPKTQLAVRRMFAAETMIGVEEVDERAEVEDDDLEKWRTLPRRAVELPRFATPAELEGVRAALEQGFADILGGGDWNAAAVRVALAHLAEEHGLVEWTPAVAREHAHPSWFAPAPGTLVYPSVWVNCLGNRQVRHDDRNPAVEHDCWHPPTVPHFRLESREVINGKDVDLEADYYAHASLREGAAAYFAALRDHYPAALAAMEAGDPALTARELKREGWYTGNEADYERAMVSVWRRVG